MAAASQHRRKLKGVLARLQSAYGRRQWRSSGDPVDVLMATILSQNTNGANSSAGFAKLKEKFPNWRAAADARSSAIARCIRSSGLGRIKATRMRSILRQIRADRGEISLEFLGHLPPEQAFDYLVAFNGVGPKTAWCVLMFAFGMEVFPVDTHIKRIAIRLGLIGPQVSADAAHQILAPMIRPEDRYEMHVLLIAHGRRMCRARRPLCDQCCLLKFCPHRREQTEALP